MKKRTNVQIVLMLLAIAFLSMTGSASAQDSSTGPKPAGTTKIDNRITYHNGPIVTGTPNLYIVWYGCWGDPNCGAGGDNGTLWVLGDFFSNLGSTPYFQINSTYPDSIGNVPSGALVYAGTAVDKTYNNGRELTASQIQGIIATQMVHGELPLDPSGIYLVLASADVGSTSTGFCVASEPPHHGYGTYLGTQFRYAFVGNPLRCPTVAAPQFFKGRNVLPTPNANLAADAMASTIAHVLSTLITDPLGSGWFDGNGLENADKCDGQFGLTYAVANGARANVKMGARDYLLQENWVNDGKGRCALTPY